ncbi:MAG: hypothetical protein QOF24_2049 [Verrucomicrobiota bacterium]
MKILSYLFSAICGVVAVILGGAALRVQPVSNNARSSTSPLSGKKAADYLVETGDGQSLMRALTAARFGLQWQEHAPGDDKTGGGYFAMSHDQDLNAWFAGDGVTVRSTLPEMKRGQAWSMALRLQAYGYGKQLVDAPPIVSRQVKENRIEYERASSNPHSAIRIPKLVEWYENRAEGIEQGFTLNDRPERHNGVGPNEPLRISLSVTGDLRARNKDEGTIELAKAEGKGGLSYSKLGAQDADGKKLAARMEANADGREIALVVQDTGARYPIVIDPIVASLEKKFGDGYTPHAEARFGFDVAIDGDRAVVGAWRDASDTGRIYFFSRSGSTWSNFVLNRDADPGGQCGYSVAIKGSKTVFGCPGTNAAAGTAYIYDVVNDNLPRQLIPSSGSRNAGDRFGSSVAISANKVIVGAPFNDNQAATDAGRVHIFTFASDFSAYSTAFVDDFQRAGNGQFGFDVAIDGNTFVVGIPGAGTGKAAVYNSTTLSFSTYLIAGDGAAGDNFGQSVGISGNTAVVGAPLNSEKGNGAGAAYVFVRDANGFYWSQQQKLTGSDSFAGNFFGASHIAIEGNTIMAGAYGYSFFDFNQGTISSAGEAYIFMRNGTVWTEQATTGGDKHAGDEFGIGVGISGNTVIVGARNATVSGVARSGAAYVYRLSCVPPSATSVELFDLNDLVIPRTVCPGTSVRFRSAGNSGFGSANSYQWRKNGVSIPGATSNSYTLNSGSSSDTGSYDIVISNSCGSDISNAIAFTVHTFSLNLASQNFGVSGSNSSVNVSCTGSCNWTAVSNASFITVTSGSSGTGNGTVGFTVAPNPNSGQRSGTITIAGLTFSVTQDGTNCSYSITPTSQTLSASASTNTVAVTAGAGCAWTATSNDSFLSINSGASGSGNGTVTYTIAANSSISPRTGTLTIAGQTFTVTQGAAGLVANVSTRLQVGQDDDALFEGFIIQGPPGSIKKIIVRALGPFLAGFGVADYLANPTLDIFQGSNRIAMNDDWRTTQIGGIITADQSTEIATGGFAPSNELESAIIANLAPGSYTAVVRGLGNTTGIGLVDAFDVSASSPAKVVNFATRGLVQPGDKLLTAGFIIQNGSVRAVIRAIGPSLTGPPFNIPNALPDTTLQLRDQNGGLIQENDDWQTDQKAELEGTGLQPTNIKEAALVRTIPPGQYSAQVRGKPEATGVGVVEIYFIQ